MFHTFKPPNPPPLEGDCKPLLVTFRESGILYLIMKYKIFRLKWIIDIEIWKVWSPIYGNWEDLVKNTKDYETREIQIYSV